MIYGYVRISTKKQVITRQIANILKIYPEAKIYQEIFTGVTSNRPEWNKLKKIVKKEMLLFLTQFQECQEMLWKGLKNTLISLKKE